MNTAHTRSWWDGKRDKLANVLSKCFTLLMFDVQTSSEDPFVLVDVFSRPPKRKLSKWNVRFMFEVAVCWFVSVLMGRKCQVAESFCPPCPCNWHFPCFVSLKYLQMQLRLSSNFFIHHKILNVNPAGKTPGHPKLSGRQQSFHFTIIHHRSVNKVLYFLRIEPDQQSNSPSPVSTKKKGVTWLQKIQSMQEEIWDSGQSASYPLSRPCRPELLIIYHSALIGPSRVLWKQLPTSGIRLNTDTDNHCGPR